jgi:hypothetical protein
MNVPTVPSFADLVASRRQWIDEVLKPWCQRAERNQLRMAELEWPDIAGRAMAEKTLWFWAWGRFPALVNDELAGIDESLRVEVTLRDGSTRTGHPDARESTHGQLVLVGKTAEGRIENLGPFSIDDIASVTAGSQRANGQQPG